MKATKLFPFGLALILLAGTGYAQQDADKKAPTLYKWVKADGTVVYTDKPVPGAVRVAIKAANTVSMPVPKAKKSLAPKKPSSQPVPSLTWIAPAGDGSIRDNAGNLLLTLDVQGRGAAKFRLLRNGQPLMTQSSPSFSLTNMDRGEHTFKVQALNSRNQVIASSPVRTIVLHRASALLPARRNR